MDKNDLNMRMKNNPFAVLSDVIYDGIYEEIINGTLMPGYKILETKLSKELDVSRTPVKMAINRLIDENLLLKTEGHIPVVKKISVEECYCLYESRKILEGGAAYIAAKNIQNDELRQLKDILVKLKESDASLDNKMFIKYDNLFHEVIINASHNQYIISMYAAISRDIHRYRCHYQQLLVERNKIENGYFFHQSIFKALHNHMAMLAKDNILADIERMYGTIFMQQNKNYDENQPTVKEDSTDK